MFLKYWPAALLLAFSFLAVVLARRHGEEKRGGEQGERSSSTPIACDLSVFDPAQREEHGKELQRLLSSAEGLESRGNQRALRFPYERALFIDAATWIADEGRCCPFFRFSLRLEPSANCFRLEIDAPVEAQAILDAALAPLETRGNLKSASASGVSSRWWLAARRLR